MRIQSDSLSFSTRGFDDMKDITDLVQERLERAKMKDGIVVVFATGSTAAVTTIEFEPGLVSDFARLMERLAPAGASYEHDRRWGDGNGFSHVRASLVGASLTVPFSDGRLRLGTWQQIVCLDFDNGPRTRTVALQFMGE